MFLTQQLRSEDCKCGSQKTYKKKKGKENSKSGFSSRLFSSSCLQLPTPTSTSEVLDASQQLSANRESTAPPALAAVFYILLYSF